MKKDLEKIQIYKSYEDYKIVAIVHDHDFFDSYYEVELSRSGLLLFFKRRDDTQIAVVHLNGRGQASNLWVFAY